MGVYYEYNKKADILPGGHIITLFAMRISYLAYHAYYFMLFSEH